MVELHLFLRSVFQIFGLIMMEEKVQENQRKIGNSFLIGSKGVNGKFLESEDDLMSVKVIIEIEEEE